jgi:peptidoglycan/LPS O-acetylase OafA/YrhL
VTGPITQRHYVPALDGLRTFAVALVILVHVSSRVAPGGWVGVDVFFVLSGYLITSVLLREQAAKGDISFSDFYIRRVLRLMPALVLLVVGDGVLAALFGGPSPNKLLDAAAALTYLMDFVRAFSHVSDFSTLGHTWSLAVEEHFYIVWPLVLVLVLRLRRSAQLPVIIAMAAAIVLWRAYLVHSGASYERTDYPADARSDQMLIGCALAFWLSSGPRASVIAMLRRLWPLGLAIILTVTVYDVTYQPWFRSFGLVAIGLASATLILELGQNQQGLLARAASFKPMVALGRISYGIYLWHYVFIMQIRYHDNSKLLVLAGVVASVVVAALSFRYVEQPFLKLKQRFEPRPDPIALPSIAVTKAS